MPIPTPNKNESNEEFVERCMSDETMQEYDNDQRLAICESQLKEEKMEEQKEMNALPYEEEIEEEIEEEEEEEIMEESKTKKSRISFDYDGTLTSSVGLESLNLELDSKNEIYIISARDDDAGLVKFAEENNIPLANVFATGSEEGKINKIKELGIERHYDDKQEVIDLLGRIGILVKAKRHKTDVWDNKHKSEKRYFTIDTRLAEQEGKDVVMGHAAIFNTLSEDLGGFRERIEPGAFDGVLENDVRAYFNHDPNYLLGRTTAGTLRLSVDTKGLRYELDVPNTTAGRDLKENIRLGNVTQSSFAFTIAKNGDSWERTENGNDIRIINEVDRLYDISPVSLPAYPDANDVALAQRSNLLDKEKQRQDGETRFEENEVELVKRSLVKLKIELTKRKTQKI